MQFWEWCLEHKAVSITIVAVVLAVLVTTIWLIVHCLNKRNGKKLFVFRRYKKFEGPPGKEQQHPKLIVEVTEDEYGFMGLTESRKHGKANNLPIKNPQKGNTRDSYIRKEVRHANKDEFFDYILKNYKLTSKDKKIIIEYLERRKKKK